jgi:hypothetical protein
MKKKYQPPVIHPRLRSEAHEGELVAAR